MTMTAPPVECSDELRAMLENIDPADNKLMRIKTSANVDRTENELREELCFFPHVQDNSYVFLREVVRSLHGYKWLLDSDDFSREDETTKEQCRALLLVTELLLQYALNEHFTYDRLTGNTVLWDTALVTLLTSNTDHTELIMGFLRDRLSTGATTVDVPLLEEILNSTAPLHQQRHPLASTPNTKAAT